MDEQRLDSLQSTAEARLRVGFDPAIEWKRIKDKVASEMKDAVEGDNWDRRISRENGHMGEFAKEAIDAGLADNYSEVFERLRAVDRARWGLRSVQDVNSKIFEGFEVSEVIDERTLIELIGVEKCNHGFMAYWRDTGHLDKGWISIDTVDAVSVGSGLAALAMKEGISLGRKAVDLGGGDGTWGFVLAQMGFDVSLIERDKRLLDQFEIEKSKLERLGVRTGNIRSIHGEFFLDDNRNSLEIRTALKEADVMVCYPWPEEIVDRMKLFKQYAKDGSLLVMYGSGFDSFEIDSREIKRNGLEVVGSEINKELKQSGNVKKWVRGYEAPSFGASWTVLKKSSSEK